MALYSVKPLYSPNVTATNGSDIVQVTGSVNCSFVMSGGIVSIAGANRLADAISGTGPDGSGNSTIKLRRPWAGATVSGPMLVFMSYEGLSDAVFQLKSLIDAAAASVEGAFSFMGDYDLAAAGALPVNPAPGAGSQMYRISTQAAVAGRTYRVGELIYYDQYLEAWRSFFELASSFSTGLLAGTDAAAWQAALGLVPTTSPTDTTAGRLLKVGDFGVGVSNGITSVDLNTVTKNGFYYCVSCTNRPAAENGYLQVLSESSSYAIQTYTARGSGRTHNRFLFNGVWQPWVEVYLQNNILGTVSQSGGVPTGAIIQRGSNANGEFVRFADGSLFSWHTLTDIAYSADSDSTPRSAAVTWTYPIAASAAPATVAHVSGVSSSGAGSFPISVSRLSSAPLSTTSYPFFVIWPASGSTRTANVTLTSSTRWFNI